ncbi:enoyl-CoA hydratase [Ectocarpus siliculosus]|uniref:Enoyl-CoA hydratase n=1 Tax=Ectocarpus siliculosus TaxID=2880 RepID=D7FLP7_ECTSI|nr:enoyl-CoA hydratase [Ectocarpus siliculosus]|eukprot:CBJ25863.1 enoyl-CoA hydratase [Ectocarpus siliculosus]
MLGFDRLDGDLKGVVRLEMKNPKANALGLKLISELEDAVEAVSRDGSVRSVVLSSGVPGVFCAGADLKERAVMTKPEAELFVVRLRSLMSKVASIPAPTIAVAEGAAFGGGLELMLACDVRVVGAKATMGLTETSLGIIPGAGGTQRLPRLIGASKAKELIFTARRVDAVRALELGMVNAVFDAGQAEKGALAMAGDMARRGPLAVRAAKLAIDEGLAMEDVEQGMAIERRLYARVLGTKDRDEGLAAFQERRPPEFTGE